MAIQYKQKCKRCNKNYVLSGLRSRYIVCDECQKREYSQEVTDPEMKELFDIPEEHYQKNYFLRDIKAKYLKYGSLSEKQIEAFKRAVKDLDKNVEEQSLDDMSK
jgi:PHP family Zn ribbon phosphoesterase